MYLKLLRDITGVGRRRQEGCRIRAGGHKHVPATKASENKKQGSVWMALMAERKDIGVSLKRLRDQQKTPLLFRLERQILHSNVGFTSGTFGGINVILCRPTGIT